MSAPTKGSGFAWVGRSIRRVEDPALLTGRGRFTADLPAAHRVRFVRSSVAAGRIENIIVPENAVVLTAADLAAVKPITPALHKFGYVPVAQAAKTVLSDILAVKYTVDPGIDGKVTIQTPKPVARTSVTNRSLM